MSKNDDIFNFNGLKFVLARTDEQDKNGLFERLRESGFSMVNVDVDSENNPYALFVRNEYLINKNPVEYFMTYSYKGKLNQKLVKDHPIVEIVEMNKKEDKHKYILTFYKELYISLPNKFVSSLRF